MARRKDERMTDLNNFTQKALKRDLTPFEKEFIKQIKLQYKEGEKNESTRLDKIKG